MDRGQFTFYASFATALRRIKRKTDRCAAYDAIINYALFEIEPEEDELPDAAMIAFELIRPNLDASRRKAVGAKSRFQKDTERIPEGYREDTGKKEEDKSETESKTETESESEFESETELETEIKSEIESKSEKESYRSIPKPLPSAAEMLRERQEREARQARLRARDGPL